MFSGEKIHFVKRHLGIMSSFNPQDEKQQAREFILHYLKDDGVFLTRLLSLNSSDLVVTELLNQLWLRYKAASRLYSSVQLEGVTRHPSPPDNRPRTTRIPLPTLPILFTAQANTSHEASSSKDTDV
jgi:hypothetical protein